MRKWIGLLLALLLLAGCTGEPAGETAVQDEAEIGSQVGEGTVVAEAVIQPAHWSALGFEGAGEVIEVLVEEGEAVTAGDLLVRLDPTDAQLAVQQAEVGLQAAEAELALTKAGARRQAITTAEDQLKAAEARQAQAVAQQDQLIAGAKEPEIAAAEAEIASLVVERMKADDRHEQTMRCFNVENPYTGEKQKICPSLGPREEQARYALKAADEALAAAEARLSDLQALPKYNDVRGAEANVQAAAAERDATQAQLDLTQAGPTDEEIAVAEAKVTRARAALEAAQAALAHTEVRAPFAGTVAMVYSEVGNAVVPGQAACTLATMGQLQARTKDLSELDVAGIDSGQSVKVTVDALPEREFEGVVREVALRAEDFRGEAVFAVTVDLVDVGDAPLRWGMTAWVEFEMP
jgi:multidrug efflux pump subunit AcrA (membrane-fusion protein)